MDTLLETVRWNVYWDMRHTIGPDAIVDAMVTDKINSMTPLELLEAISKTLEENKQNG